MFVRLNAGGVSHFEEHDPAKPNGALISNDKETLLQTHHQQMATVGRT